MAAAGLPAPSAPDSRAHNARGLAGILIVAAVILLLHLLTNTRYGFHRDELQFLSDALHLDWGYVAYPPLTPFIEHVSIAFFGFSLEGLRLFSVFAQVAIIIVAGLIARTLGGGWMAQTMTALAVALSPVALFEGTEFQYTTFEQFAWVLAIYGVVRLLKEEDGRWWIWIGAFAGLGLMAKYTVAFFVASLLAGFLLTPERRLLASRWFAIGCAVTVLIVLPNLIWQFHHNFISYHFLKFIHARDLRIGRGSAREFWLFQAIICADICALPFTIAGVIFAWRSKRYRALALAFVITVLLFAFTKGRGYYTSAVYPPIVAFGAVVVTAWASRVRPLLGRAVLITLWIGTIGAGVIASAELVPIATRGPLKAFALAHSGDLREEQGWDTLVATIAHVRDTLPAEQRANFGIVTANYGEQGAVEILGRAYGLPAPISLTNSAWLRGYPTPQPTTLIVTGLDFDDANDEFTNCRLAAPVPYPANLNNEESNYHPDIFLCGVPRLPWPEFWKKYQRFG
jgi:hypothetical protein